MSTPSLTTSSVATESVPLAIPILVGYATSFLRSRRPFSGEKSPSDPGRIRTEVVARQAREVQKSRQQS